MPQQDLRPRPSPAWYLVTVVLWIAATVVAVIAIKPVVEAITSDLTAYPYTASGADVSIPADGATIYATDRPTGMTCTATDVDGGDAFNLEEFKDNTSYEIDPPNAPKVSAVANTPVGMPAGTYTIECDGLGKGFVATGERIDIEDIGKQILIGFGIGGLLGLIGLVVLIVMLVKRHNSKKRIREAQTNAQYGWPPQGGGGYPPPAQYGGYPPPGGQPSGGYTPPPPAYGSDPNAGYGTPQTPPSDDDPPTTTYPPTPPPPSGS